MKLSEIFANGEGIIKITDEDLKVLFDKPSQSTPDSLYIMGTLIAERSGSIDQGDFQFL